MDEVSELWFRLGKRSNRSSTNYSLCIVCQERTSESLHNLTDAGYPAFHHAISNRGDDTATRMMDDIKCKDIFLSLKPKYHTKCRNQFTNKKSVEQKKRARLNEDGVDDSGEKPESSETSPGTRSSSSKVDFKKVCFVCEKSRDKTGDRTLILVATKDRQEKIFIQAKALNDTKMLHKIQGYGVTCIDLIAYDFRYHKKCLSFYMLQCKLKGSTSVSSVDEYNYCFDAVVSDIGAKLLNENTVYYVSQLRDQVRKKLREKNVENAELYSSRYLIKQLESHFEGNIAIVPQVGTSNLVCSSALSLSTVLSEVKKLKGKLETWEYLDDRDDRTDPGTFECDYQLDSYHAAKKIRKEVKDVEQNRHQKLDSGEPSDAYLDISYEEASEIVPTALYNHMAWMIFDIPYNTEQDGRVSLQQKQHKKILNICQDIIASMSSIPTPKHVGIALHAIKQTRCKETVTILNRFGNCISYNDAQRYITSMALSAEEQTLDSGFFIPHSIKPGLFTQFAFDNLDFQENTLDGTTTHGTTHIIYQYPSDTTETNSSVKVFLHKPRTLSLHTVEPFQTTPAMLTLSDRRESRSLCGMKLVPDGDFDDNENNTGVTFLYNLCQGGSTDLLDFLDELNPTTWKQFHELLIADTGAKTIIGYGPFFPQSPTHPDVVAESVNYCIGVTKKLGQEHCIITCDQAIYEIVLALQKKNPDKYGNVILRMGGFHIAMNFLGAIGYLMKETGIEDILVESGICQPGTVNKLLDGKDYYAMIHAHTVVERAMFGLLWESFESWTLEQGQDTEAFSELSSCISAIIRAINEEQHEQARTSYEEGKAVINTMRQELDEFSKVNFGSPTSKLWIMYLHMIGILKRFIIAERSGNWNLHLQATGEMLPYIVSSGHNKYTSCLPHYLAAMKDLPAAVKSEFMKGNFTVRQRRGKFNGVWSDMALEKTYNKDAKTKLLNGITKRQDTISKYLKALPTLTAVSEKTIEMVHMNQDSETCERRASERDLRQVQKIKSIIVETMVNPFLSDCSEALMNISSGETTKSLELIDARKKGIDALEKAEKAKAKKVDPVKIKRFVEKVKKKPVLMQTAELYKEERAVIRELCFAENLVYKEKVDAFSHEWTKYPSSLFLPDQLHPDKVAMRKGNKSDYGNMIETTMDSDWKCYEELPEGDLRTGYFIDLMAFIQRFQNMWCSTFIELSKRYIEKILQMRPKQCNIVHVVGDRYDFGPQSSLKAEERLRRQKSSIKAKSFQPHDNLRLPLWKGYLDTKDNKQNLEKYLLETWTSHPEWIPQGCEIILGGMTSEPAKHLSAVGVRGITALECNDHEEADTRIFAHISFSAQEQSCRRAVIYANDTDILVLGIYHSKMIQGLTELWIQKGGIFIPCHWISQYLHRNYSSSTSCAILSAYALTGCDTVSYIFNCGKKRALKVALGCYMILEPFVEYGLPPESNHEVSEAIVKSALKYVYALYGKKDFTGSLDELRCHLFKTKKSDIRSLPPTSDAFHLHLKRALYQILIWKRASNPTLFLPPPTEFGRNTDKGYLLATRMMKSPKPNLPSNKCNCQKDKCRLRCPCRKAEVQCTKQCRCDGDPVRCNLAAENLNEYEYLI